MRRVDLSANPEIGELTGILRSASTVTDPAELVAAFGRWVARRFPRDCFVSVSRRGLPEGSYKLTRVITGPALGQTSGPPAANPWRDWKALPSHTGGLVGEILARDEPQLIDGLRLETDPVLGPALGPEAARLVSVAAMPTFDAGRSINWGLSFSSNSDWLSLDQFANGLLDINMMGTATRNLVALKRVAELHDQLKRQLEQVATVQRSLLPESLPKIPGVRLATSYLTSAEAGGDYYDFFDLGGGRWGILIADVAGHGAAAATVMAMLRAILHSYEGTERSPRAMMRFCNAKLAASRLEGSFTTAFYAVLDTATGEMTYSRCGHNPPRLRRADGRVESLEEGASLPLGVTEDPPLEEGSARLSVGDTVVLYTDGITEAYGPRRSARDMFGVHRLDLALRECTGEPSCVVDSIHKSLFAHTSVMDRDDDQTLVVFRYLGPGHG